MQAFIKYRNPVNDYEIVGSDYLSWLRCMLFGPLYFAVKGIWVHAIVSSVLTYWSYGLWLPLHAVFVYAINDKFYQSRGWIRVNKG